MATSEKLLSTCRSAVPFRPRVWNSVTLTGGGAVTVRAWRLAGGTLAELPGRASGTGGQAVRQTESGNAGRVRHSPDSPRGRDEGGSISEAGTVGCLAVQDSLTLWLDSSLTSLTKARKVLPTLLDVQLPFPLEECIYQFVEFRRTPEGTVSALVCAARREAIQACLARYQAQVYHALGVGLDPMLLDHEGLALWTQSLVEWPAVAPSTSLRAMVGGPAEPSQHRALICLESDHLTLVMGSGTRYSQAHSLQTPAQSASADDLVNRLQLLLHAGFPARPPAAPVAQPLRAGNATHPPATLERSDCGLGSVADGPAGAEVQWLFCGARAGETAVVNALHQSLAQSWPGKLMIAKEPALFLARALGERALKRGPLRCNMRQLSLTHPVVRRMVERRARAAVVSILAAGVALMGFSLASRLLAERRFNRVKAEIARLAAELAPGLPSASPGVVIPYGREVPEVQKAWEKQAPLTKPFLEAFAPSLAVRLAEVIRAGKAAAVRFETLNLRRDSLALTGLAEDWDQCGELEERLKALGYAVKLERQEAVAETEVRFSIKAEGGAP
ncbi:MAG: hypothetical protein HYV36_01105 [Lentisphaerae bacterium]|nr:hypothetical protein [Lentisphaerota bacterium]